MTSQEDSFINPPPGGDTDGASWSGAGGLLDGGAFGSAGQPGSDDLANIHVFDHDDPGLDPDTFATPGTHPDPGEGVEQFIHDMTDGTHAPSDASMPPELDPGWVPQPIEPIE